MFLVLLLAAGRRRAKGEREEAARHLWADPISRTGDLTCILAAASMWLMVIQLALCTSRELAVVINLYMNTAITHTCTRQCLYPCRHGHPILCVLPAYLGVIVRDGDGGNQEMRPSLCCVVMMCSVALWDEISRRCWKYQPVRLFSLFYIQVAENSTTRYG